MRRLLGCVSALVLSSSLTSCVSSEAVPCGDAGVCAPGSSCATVKDLDDKDHAYCVLPEQIEQCAAAADRAPCMLTVGGMQRAATCHGGVCLVDECGNRMLDSAEVCDDGNTGAGDGCSDDCKSAETCGNGLLDPLRIENGVSRLAELCDDHGFVAHDGCSPACGLELPRWTQIFYGEPGARSSHVMTWDATHGHALLFSGLGAANTASGETWDWNGSGWRRHGVDVEPIARSGTAMAHDSSRNQTVMFGGKDGAFSILGDTWVWDGRDWTQVAASPQGPAKRAFHAMAYDSGRKRIVMFGGEDGSAFADTWEWDGSAWMRGPSAGPSARRGHMMAYDPKRGQIVLFGGVAGPAASAETWTYDGTAWTKKSPGTSPPAREAGGMAWDPNTERVLLYGGVGTSYYADTWAWDGTTWTPVPAVSTPPALARMTLVSDPIRSRVVMFGGATGATASTSQLWEWNGTSWNQASWDAPPVVSAPAVALDSDRRRVVLFGGQANAAVNNETYELVDGRWIHLPFGLGQRPGLRMEGAMVYDQERRELVLFGGSDGANPVGDGTWTLKNGTWTPHTLGQSPTPRTAHRMVYDAGAKETLLFGGITALLGLPRNDTWTWNGTSWTPRTTPPAMTARSVPALGYDPIRKVVVLFGGQPAGSVALGDLWEWSGGQWTEKTPAIQPPARAQASFAWDPARRALVLGAGVNGMQDVRDTWEWNGTVWTRVEATAPPARTGAISVTDPDGAGVLVIGGGIKSGAIADAYRLRWESSTADDTCAGTSDLDGDGLRGCADPDCWASCGTCGNGTCDALESCTSCPMDCTCGAKCGDFVCAGGETHASCPGDCP